MRKLRREYYAIQKCDEAIIAAITRVSETLEEPYKFGPIRQSEKAVNCLYDLQKETYNYGKTMREGSSYLLKGYQAMIQNLEDTVKRLEDGEKGEN